MKNMTLLRVIVINMTLLVTIAVWGQDNSIIAHRSPKHFAELQSPKSFHNNCADELKNFEHSGGLHTEKQLADIKLRINKKPWKQAYEQLIEQADNLLTVTPSPMKDYNVAYFYGNKKEPSLDKERLSKDAFGAYTLALAYRLGCKEKASSYADKAVEILNDWARTNKTISGFDGDLSACYCGVPMVLAAELLKGYPNWNQSNRTTFKKWLSDTLLKSANKIKFKKDNHGCWGLYTSLACNYYLDNREDFQNDIVLLKKQISMLINEKGELPSENKRTNSGMWYTYFALCPLTCSAAIVTNSTGENIFQYVSANGRSLKSALDAFFKYCERPDSWPYKKPSGVDGIIYNTLYPSADQVKMPQPDSWPGNLFEAMLGVYYEEKWELWLKPHRPICGGRGWIWPTLTNYSIQSSKVVLIENYLLTA